MDPSPEASPPTFREAVEVWATIASQSFGGPAGQIAVMHRTLVEEKRWIGEERFLHALNTCMLLPGPEAQQLLTYVGWLSHGTLGGLVAGWLFVVPGFGALLGLSLVYVQYHELPAVAAALYGLEAAVLAVLFEAVLRIGRRVLDRPSTWMVAIAAFVALFLFEVPFPIVIGVAGGLGAALPSRFPPPVPPTVIVTAGERPWIDAMLDADRLPHVHPSPGRDLALAAAIVVAWLLPTAILWATLGPDATFTRVGQLFSTSSLVTFGGAYAVLAYVGQQAVEVHHWLLPGEMLDGLGLAETTPGPLIQVVQFVGFLAAFREPGSLTPVNAAILGAILTTWVTFWPSFLFVLAGGPYVEEIRKLGWLSSALRAITASVVGVVANLAVWSTLHVWFATVTEITWNGARLLLPDPGSVRPLGIGISIAAAIALVGLRVPRTIVLLCGILVGLSAWLVGF